MPHKSSRKSLNIGFISFRFAGTDGVSLETSKWAEVLEDKGHTCYYFSGLSDRPDERSMVVPEAQFRLSLRHRVNQRWRTSMSSASKARLRRLTLRLGDIVCRL